jgi:predicted dehydrogenase
MLLEFGKAGWFEKVRQQPEKFRIVLDKIKADGLIPTLEAVNRKLDQPLPLGYCNVGTAIDVGLGVTGVAVGDRMVSNGKHAEVVSVPMNLSAKVPDNVPDDEAAFTVIGAVSLQGIRLVQPSLGDAVVVIGLGLIGLITVQLLREHGCRVLGIDFDSQRTDLARQFGAEIVNPSFEEDAIAAAHELSRGRGVDAVIIAASTNSSKPVHEAALMCRKRGRIVLVGVTGLELSRADFFEKELSFQVSCSYGPGRYDANYEQNGVDYPFGFVRWTAQRNFEAVLDLMAARKLDVKPLISHRFPIADAGKAYELIGATAKSLGILLEYSTGTQKSEVDLRQPMIMLSTTDHSQREQTTGTVAFIGSGNYASATLIPSFRKAGAQLRTVCSIGGLSAFHAARKFGFEQTTTDAGGIFSDSRIDAVVISTRHDSHAGLVLRALSAGKHVFVEKPLALTVTDLDEIERTYLALIRSGRNPILMIGFNRRFAPHVRKVKSLLSGVKQPKVFALTVNAGAIPLDHWTQDGAVGGGRIIGEVCHFIDLLLYLAGSRITEFQRTSIDQRSAKDNTSITLRFEDGSIGTILYCANGHKSFQKERLEIFAAGHILQLNNYRKLIGFGWPGFSKMNLWRQDKGQNACAAAFIEAARQSKPAPIPFADVMEVSRRSIEIAQAHEISAHSALESLPRIVTT